MQPIDAADETFLESAADDLQRQLGASGTVVAVATDDAGSSVAMVATVRVGHRMVELRGEGENILTAYADLCRAAPEPILVSAFDQVIGV
jgi:hypothetical protein